MRTIYRLALGAGIVAMLVVLAAGCGTGTTSPSGSAVDSVTGTDTLTGSTWRLVAWGNAGVLPAEVEITAQFAEGQITGNAGVNSYFGPYTVDGGAFTTGELGRTLMAGPEPAMQAEDTYLSLLAEVRSYNLAGDMLMLNDADENALLQFERVSP
jgi:heat shock protein HslJ